MHLLGCTAIAPPAGRSGPPGKLARAYHACASPKGCLLNMVRYTGRATQSDIPESFFRCMFCYIMV
jgi:hypothetical protein